MKNIKSFFEEYGQASLQGRSKEVANHYAKNFMVATKKETMTFANDEKFLEWLDDVAVFNKKSGMQEMKVVNIEFVAIGQYHTNATVTWGVKFKKKPDKLIQFDIQYLLNHFGGEYKIILYISDEDQEKLMAKEGLI